MSCKILPLALLTVVVLAPISGRTEPLITLKSVTVDLPDSGRMFPSPGADAINNNCLACHSAGMVLNQPALAKSAWQGEVTKIDPKLQGSRIRGRRACHRRLSGAHETCRIDQRQGIPKQRRKRGAELPARRAHSLRKIGRILNV
jgi:hypothetical protein